MKFRNFFCLFVAFLFTMTSAFPLGVRESIKNTFYAINSSPLLRLMIALGVVLALIYATSFLYMKLTKYNKKHFTDKDGVEFDLNEFKIVSSMSMGQNKNLYVVEINNKYLVLGATQSNISLIKEFDKTELMNKNSDLENDFSKLEEMGNPDFLIEEAKKIDQTKEKEFNDVLKKYL